MSKGRRRGPVKVGSGDVLEEDWLSNVTCMKYYYKLFKISIISRKVYLKVNMKFCEYCQAKIKFN